MLRISTLTIMAAILTGCQATVNSSYETTVPSYKTECEWLASKKYSAVEGAIGGGLLGAVLGRNSSKRNEIIMASAAFGALVARDQEKRRQEALIENCVRRK